MLKIYANSCTYIAESARQSFLVLLITFFSFLNYFLVLLITFLVLLITFLVLLITSSSGESGGRGLQIEEVSLAYTNAIKKK